MNPIFANIRDGLNAGDMFCSASAVFPEIHHPVVLDFRAVIEGPSPLIVGGGGLLHPGVDDWIERQSKIRPVILFGVGVNYHDPADIDRWKEKIRKCVLVGLRDKPLCSTAPNVEYCPCPTMGVHDWPHARREATHEKPLGVYEHYEHPIDVEVAVEDRLTNRWMPGGSIHTFVQWLGRYRTVVTNSYHGALWSARLGCRTVLYRPFSNRFVTGIPVKLPVAHEPDQIGATIAAWDCPDYATRVAADFDADEVHLWNFMRRTMDYLT